MSSSLHEKLIKIVTKFSADVGIIHGFDARKNELHLITHTDGFPDELLKRTRIIPVGKGITGVVAATKKPIVISDILIDKSPAILPLAREIGIRGMMAIPLFYQNELVGTIGIGYAMVKESSSKEVEDFIQEGNQLAKEIALVSA